MILKKFEVFLSFDVNNYLLIDEIEKEAVLIDCTGDIDKIEKELEKYNSKLKYVLLTHGHFDHIYGLKEIKDKLNPTIIAHKEDKELIDNIEIQCNMFGISTPQKQNVDVYIDENSKLEFGKYDIKIIHTPGHTKGGVSYLIDNKLFSGDTLFFESVGRCDLHGGNFDEIVNSIAKKLYVLDPKTEVFSGHGRNTTIGHEKENNFYVNKNSIE